MTILTNERIFVLITLLNSYDIEDVTPQDINHDTYTDVTHPQEGIGSSDVLISCVAFTVMSTNKVRNENNDYQSCEASANNNWNQHVHLVLVAAATYTCKTDNAWWIRYWGAQYSFRSSRNVDLHM